MASWRLLHYGSLRRICLGIHKGEGFVFNMYKVTLTLQLGEGQIFREAEAESKVRHSIHQTKVVKKQALNYGK